MNLRNEHFQNAARGPLKYVGPGRSAPHFEIVHFEKKLKRAATPCLRHSVATSEIIIFEMRARTP